MSTPRRDYAADDFEIQQERDRTPRATALLNLILEAQGLPFGPEQQKGLESLAFALGLHRRWRDDLTPAGELSFRARLEKIIGKEAL